MKRLEFGEDFQAFYKSNIVNKINNDVKRFLFNGRNKLNDLNIKSIKFDQNFIIKQVEDNKWEMVFTLESKFHPSSEDFNIEYMPILKTLKNLENVLIRAYPDLEDIQFEKEESKVMNVEWINGQNYKLTIYLIFNFTFNGKNWLSLIQSSLTQFVFNVIKIFQK